MIVGLIRETREIMDQTDLYPAANMLQRRDARNVLQEYGHILRPRQSKDQLSVSYSSGSSSASSGDEEDDLQEVQQRPVPRLLDIGTGSGDVLVDYVAPVFAGTPCHLLGTDISEEMVKFAREQYASVENLEFDRLDILDIRNFLERHRQPFDHVVSFYCLHWVQDQPLAMGNIYRLLAEGGNYLMAFIGNMAIFDIYEEMAQTRKWSKFMFDVSGWRGREVRRRS